MANSPGYFARGSQGHQVVFFFFFNGDWYTLMKELCGMFKDCPFLFFLSALTWPWPLQASHCQGEGTALADCTTHLTKDSDFFI